MRKFLRIFSLMNVLHHCRYVKPPIFTLCVGNARGEAAMLLAAGSRENRSALPSSTINDHDKAGIFVIGGTLFYPILYLASFSFLTAISL